MCLPFLTAPILMVGRLVLRGSGIERDRMVLRGAGSNKKGDGEIAGDFCGGRGREGGEGEKGGVQGGKKGEEGEEKGERRKVAGTGWGEVQRVNS